MCKSTRPAFPLVCHLENIAYEGLFGVAGYCKYSQSHPTLASAQLGRKCDPARPLTYLSPYPGLAMHTLFGTNILSPPPAPTTQENPFELKFHASSGTDSTASASSCSAHSSSTEYSLLTRRLQDERQALEDSRNVEPVTVRRKGHPKLLLMGQRRWGFLTLLVSIQLTLILGVASLRFKMSYYRKCPRRRHFTLNPPTR